MIFVENKLEQVALTKFRTTNITVCYLPQISIESLLYPQSPLRSYASPVTIFIQIHWQSWTTKSCKKKLNDFFGLPEPSNMITLTNLKGTNTFTLYLAKLPTPPSGRSLLDLQTPSTRSSFHQPKISDVRIYTIRQHDDGSVGGVHSSEWGYA